MYCSPRHRLRFNSRNEGSIRVDDVACNIRLSLGDANGSGQTKSRSKMSWKTFMGVSRSRRKSDAARMKQQSMELGLGRESGALGGAGAGSGSFHGGDNFGGSFGVDAPARTTSAFDGWLAAAAFPSMSAQDAAAMKQQAAVAAGSHAANTQQHGSTGTPVANSQQQQQQQVRKSSPLEPTMLSD